MVKSYGPDTDFWYVCTATLTLEVWPWVKVMTHPFVMDNNCMKYYPDPTWQWEVLARTLFFVRVCALRPWHWRYDLGSRSWHTLWSWTTIVWNTIQIEKGVKSYPLYTIWTDGQADTETGVIPLFCLRGVGMKKIDMSIRSICAILRNRIFVEVQEL